MRVDYDNLSNEIRRVFNLKHPSYHPLFRTLKRELSQLGYWRNKPRGDPAKGFKAMKEKEKGK